MDVPNTPDQNQPRAGNQNPPVVAPRSATELPAAMSPQRHAIVMFSDVVDSVKLKRELGDVAYLDVLNAHNRVIKHSVREESGEILGFTGDGILMEFRTSANAVCAALRIQNQLRDLHQSIVGPKGLQIRLGIHGGTVIQMKSPVGGISLSGYAVDLAARVMSLAAPGQILLTRHIYDDAVQYVRKHPAPNENLPLQWETHGQYTFKGPPAGWA